MTFFGYVDPGLGLLLWQAIVSAFLGVLFYIKKTRTLLLSPFQKILRPRKRPVIQPIKVQEPASETVATKRPELSKI